LSDSFHIFRIFNLFPHQEERRAGMAQWVR